MIEYYSAIKKKKILPFVIIWMDLVYIMLSEISQTEKDKYHLISVISGILKKKQQQANLKKHRHKKCTHTKVKLIGTENSG